MPMLQAIEAPLNRAATRRVRTLRAPIRGLNTRDKLLDNGDSSLFAPIMTNWEPVSSRLELRKGCTSHATGMASEPVETLMAYSGGGTEKLFAACDDSIYDVTSAGAVGSADLSSLANARWQHTMFATTSGQYLVAVNGADGVRTYSGSAWATQTVEDASMNDLGAGFVHVCAHKNRLWFAEADSLNAWYLDTYAIAGTATKLDLSALCSRGGTLQAIATWTYDGGAGPDDYWVAITSEGQVAVYSGTDPSTADTWALVGVYQIDRPVGRRCVAKYGADLAVFTETGPVLLTQVLRAIDQKDGLADPIRDNFITGWTEGGSAYGWQILMDPGRSWLVCNVATSVDGVLEQYVYSTRNKAWWKCSGWNASSFEVLGGDLYYGGQNGVVYQAAAGTSDAGAMINADLQWPWSRLGTWAVKNFTQARPNVFTDGLPIPAVEVKVDFDDTVPSTIPTPTLSPGGSEWDSAAWDDALWSDAPRANSKWVGASGRGTVAAPRMLLSTATAYIAVTSCDLAFEIGSGI